MPFMFCRLLSYHKNLFGTYCTTGNSYEVCCVDATEHIFLMSLLIFCLIDTAVDLAAAIGTFLQQPQALSRNSPHHFFLFLLLGRLSNEITAFVYVSMCVCIFLHVYDIIRSLCHQTLFLPLYSFLGGCCL